MRKQKTKHQLKKEQEKKERLARRAHTREYNRALQKRAEREGHQLQRGAEKLINQNTHIVRSTSENEQQRIAKSMLPKEKIEITDIREYRKNRKKSLRVK